MIERFQPTSVPPPAGPYSAGIKMGNLLFLAGQGPFDSNGERVGATFGDQARATFDNLNWWQTQQEHRSRTSYGSAYT